MIPDDTANPMVCDPSREIELWIGVDHSTNPEATQSCEIVSEKIVRSGFSKRVPLSHLFSSLKLFTSAML